MRVGNGRVEIKVGNWVWDRGCQSRVMAIVDGWLMLRRRGCAPYCAYAREIADQQPPGDGGEEKHG